MDVHGSGCSKLGGKSETLEKFKESDTIRGGGMSVAFCQGICAPAFEVISPSSQTLRQPALLQVLWQGRVIEKDDGIGVGGGEVLRLLLDVGKPPSLVKDVLGGSYAVTSSDVYDDEAKVDCISEALEVLEMLEMLDVVETLEVLELV